ncbi:hypothetical protein INT45_013317 [Circinella minor]|uniref:Arrestin-like N-terminal domain-containing protein n=1 Tax=Circinella minor TaxID=1195481 RepID=A0A8H7S5A8_9FUNG|nr:hypothetical protein INT45_013317 [Circinella minor]
MFSHLISSPHTLDIELLEPVIYLHGRRSDAVIRGSIGVTVHKPHTLKSLVLLFEGRSRIKHGDYKVSRKRIARHQLTIYPTTTTSNTSSSSSSQRPFLLQTGKSRFGFEMRLPPGLAGTLHCKEIKVDYKLMASIQYLRHPSSSAIVKRDISKPIYLVRSPLSSTMSALVNSENVDPCVDSQKQHSRWCQYHITIDQRSVVLGQVLPITLSIAPHLDGLCLEHVYTQIIERRHIRGKKHHGDLNEDDGDEEWETYKSTHMLLPMDCNQQQEQQIDEEGYSPGKSIPLREPWQDTLRYHVSSVMENGLVRTSKKESPDYYIDHTVNVSFVISFPVLGRGGETRRYTKTLMFQSDIELLDPNMCSTAPVLTSSTTSSTLSSPSPSFLSLNEMWMKGGTSNENQQQQQQSDNSSNMQVLPPYEEHGSFSPRMTSSRLPSFLLSSHNNGYLTTVSAPSSSRPSSPSSSSPSSPSSTPRRCCSPPRYDQIFAL